MGLPCTIQTLSHKTRDARCVTSYIIDTCQSHCNSVATRALLQGSVTFKLKNSVLSCWAAWPFCSKVLESIDVGADSAKGEINIKKIKKMVEIIDNRVGVDLDGRNCCGYRPIVSEDDSRSS